MAQGEGYTLHCGDCREWLPTLPDASVDCVISDPPYPEISREYGRMTEADWMDMMKDVVRQTRRILKPTGSAVFILQPNSEKVGRMRLWLWRFMVWAGEEWGIVQDAYWWNYNALPVGGAITNGLMRGSVKPIIWLGNSDCYRNQDAALWSESHRLIGERLTRRFLRGDLIISTSGRATHRKKIIEASTTRNGVTPYNLMPVSNNDAAHNEAGAHGHGAGTPLKLADWWTRYICPPGGVVADWFAGSGTMGIAALQNGCSFVGCEKMPKYYEVARQRLDAEANKAKQATLFAEVVA